MAQVVRSQILSPNKKIVHWGLQENQKIFLEKFAAKFNIKNPKEWGLVSKQQICKEGGETLLREYYSFSLYEALKSNFKEHKWERSWFRSEESQDKQKELEKWKNKEVQREFFDNLAKKLQINFPSDWGKVTIRKVIENGGVHILRQYNRSLYSALASAYPNTNWQRDWFCNLKEYPIKFWTEKETQRKFFENLSLQLGVHEPRDWGKVSTRQVIKLGGNSILRIYGRSLFRALKNIFPEISWERNWFSNIKEHSKWKSLDRKRKFLRDFELKAGIKKPSDWGNITTLQFSENGGAGILRMYDNSLMRLLKAIRPDVDWKSEWFQQSIWRDKNLQRNFLDAFANKFRLKKPQDWGNITTRFFIHNGGSGLLSVFNGSVFKMLSTVYSETSWKREWFPNAPKYPATYWESSDNQRQFLESIASQYNLSKVTDWQKISSSLIKSKGGRGLLTRHGNSLLRALMHHFPHLNLKQIASENMSNPHHRVKSRVKKLLQENSQ